MQTKIGEMVIVTGSCTKDAEMRLVGDKQTPMCTFSLAVGKRQDTTTIFVNCKAWRKLAEYAQNIRKGDSVIVVGELETNEYNGKTYTNLVAEWLNFVGSGSSAELSPSGKPFPVGVQFEEDKSDGELPF